METFIGSQIEITNPSQEILDWANSRLILDNPEYKQLMLMGKERLIKWQHVPEKLYLYAQKGNKLILPFGLLKAVWKFIKDSPFDTNFNNAGEISIKDCKPTFPLYDYQEVAVKAIIAAKGGVLVSCCGSGKSVCGIETIRRIGRKALWLCMTGDLLRQAKRDMEELYPSIKVGLTTEGKLEIGEDVTISTVQTLSRIDPALYKNEFDVIICDECAHVCSFPSKLQMFGKILSNVPARIKIGLTATPSRSDANMIRAMYAYIGTDNKGDFAPTYKVDRSQVKTIQAIHEKIEIQNGYDDVDSMLDIYDSSGMIIYNDLIAALSGDNVRTDKIIDNVVKCDLEGRKQVVLALRVEHCKIIVEKLLERGVKAVLCTGTVTAKRRNEILTGKVDWQCLVATYSLLKEGVSIKELDTLHLATPIKEKAMIVQSVGRIERYMDNKKQPIVYDYVDMDIPYCVKAYDTRRRALKTRF